MATRMLQRRGSAAEWAAANPILAEGEIGEETDNHQIKIGTGLAWNSTPYSNVSPQIVDAKGDLIVGSANDTVARLARGATGQRLTVQADGSLAWETPPADVPLSTVVAAGDLLVGSGLATIARLAKGADGKVLTMSGGALSWQNLPASVDIPLSTVTTAEDLIVGSGAGTVKRVAKGANNQVLTVVGGVLTWVAPSADVPLSTVTTAEDLIVGSGAGAVKRVGKGANNQFLRVVAGVLTWVDSPDVPLSTVTTAGDLIVGSGAGVTRLARGSNEQVLAMNGNVVQWLTRFGIQTCLSSARPAGPQVGQPIFETDTKALRIWDGSGWMVVPTGGSPFGFIMSAGSNFGRMVQSGSFTFSMTSGSGGAAALGPVAFGATFANTPVVVATGNYAVGLYVGLIITVRPTSTNFQYMADTKSGTYTGSVAGNNYIATDA